MGIRLHKTVGWGMSIKEFKKTTLLLSADKNDKDKTEALSDVMSYRTKSIPISDIEYKSRRTFSHHNVLMKVGTGKWVTNKQGVQVYKYKTEGNASDLFKVICDPDKTHAVVFYPSPYYAKSFTHYSDTIDYIEECVNKKTGKHKDTYSMATKIVTLEYNPYPFSNNLMDNSGNWIPWTGIDAINHYPIGSSKPIAGVPGEIQLYTERLGIFDQAGWAKLRPMYCKYWG